MTIIEAITSPGVRREVLIPENPYSRESPCRICSCPIPVTSLTLPGVISSIAPMVPSAPMAYRTIRPSMVSPESQL
ncbi:MAG: hypothetical protein KH281_04910 [Lachnospiraceae bacterium]|nr:hypothetical protein [Lachnospiraceae bacterium]